MCLESFPMLAASSVVNYNHTIVKEQTLYFVIAIQKNIIQKNIVHSKDQKLL